MVEPQNFVIRQGVTFRRKITWKDEQGIGIPLAGATIRLQGRLKDGSLVLDMSLENAAISLGAAAGEFWLFQSPAQTTALPVDLIHYDLQVSVAEGTVTDLLSGVITILPRIIQ